MKAIICIGIALMMMLGAAATAGANSFDSVSNLIGGLDGINDIWIDGKKLMTDILNNSDPANVKIKDKTHKKPKKHKGGISIPDVPAVVLVTLMIVVGIIFRKKIFRRE